VRDVPHSVQRGHIMRDIVFSRAMVGAALHCGGHKTGAQAVAKIASAMAPLAAGVVASPRPS